MLSTCHLQLSRRAFDSTVHTRSIRMSLKQVSVLPRPSLLNPWPSVVNPFSLFYCVCGQILPLLSPWHSVYYSYYDNCLRSLHIHPCVVSNFASIVSQSTIFSTVFTIYSFSRFLQNTVLKPRYHLPPMANTWSKKITSSSACAFTMPGGASTRPLPHPSSCFSRPLFLLLSPSLLSFAADDSFMILALGTFFSRSVFFLLSFCLHFGFFGLVYWVWFNSYSSWFLCSCVTSILFHIDCLFHLHHVILLLYRFLLSFYLYFFFLIIVIVVHDVYFFVFIFSIFIITIIILFFSFIYSFVLHLLPVLFLFLLRFPSSYRLKQL